MDHLEENKNENKAKTSSTGKCLFVNVKIGECTPDDTSAKNYMSVDNDLGMHIVREVNDSQGQGSEGEPRKSNREIAAERREALTDRYKSYQEKAKRAMQDGHPIKLKTKPLSQLKESLILLSDDFNFNFRGIDGSTRHYLGKGKNERDVSMTQDTSSIFKSIRK